MPSVQEAKEHVRGHPHPAQVSSKCPQPNSSQPTLLHFINFECFSALLLPSSAQEALKTGHFVRVLEVLMQLQKICNHPDLIQPRDTHNSYVCQPLQYNTPSLLLNALQQDQWKVSRRNKHRLWKVNSVC